MMQFFTKDVVIQINFFVFECKTFTVCAKLGQRDVNFLFVFCALHAYPHQNAVHVLGTFLRPILHLSFFAGAAIQGNQRPCDHVNNNNGKKVQKCERTALQQCVDFVWKGGTSSLWGPFGKFNDVTSPGESTERAV